MATNTKTNATPAEIRLATSELDNDLASLYQHATLALGMVEDRLRGKITTTERLHLDAIRREYKTTLARLGEAMRALDNAAFFQETLDRIAGQGVA